MAARRMMAVRLHYEIDVNDRVGVKRVLPAHRGSALVFRDFEASDKDAAIQLLSMGRRAGYAEFKRRLFDWQFTENPHADGRAPFLVGELDGRIVALNGFMPARVRWNGDSVAACWSCDTYVSSNHRGQGIGKRLIEHVTNAASLMLGYGISDMSDPIFEKYGWRLCADVELAFFHASDRGIRGKIQNVLSRAASFRSGSFQRVDYEVWTELAPELVSQLDDLWHRSAPAYGNLVERDGAYLLWKYFRHPFYQYRAYAMRCADTLSAVLIARHDAIESVIVDYIGPPD
jgi:GNAT superfamily N-acetyltransferase